MHIKRGNSKFHVIQQHNHITLGPRENRGQVDFVRITESTENLLSRFVNAGV